MGEDRPRAECPGPVVDVEIVERLREQPADLGDLVVVLREVRLPVRAHRGRHARRLAQHVGGARDREPRRERVAQPAVVAPVPACAQVGRLAERELEDLGG